MSTSGDMRRPGRNRIRTISSIFAQTAKDVSGSAEQLSNLVTSVMIPATPPESTMAYYDPNSGGAFQRDGNAFRTAANGVLATIIQLFFILSFAPVLLFAIFVVLTIALLTSGTITLALGAITISGTALALSLFTCVLPLSALSAVILFVVRTTIQTSEHLLCRIGQVYRVTTIALFRILLPLIYVLEVSIFAPVPMNPTCLPSARVDTPMSSKEKLKELKEVKDLIKRIRVQLLAAET